MFTLLVFAQISYLHRAISNDHVLPVFVRVLNLHNVLRLASICVGVHSVLRLASICVGVHSLFAKLSFADELHIIFAVIHLFVGSIVVHSGLFLASSYVL